MAGAERLIWNTLRHFTPGEFAPHAAKMSPELLRLLDGARGRAGVSFVVTSHYRPGDDGAHGRGLAVDIRAHGSADRMAIVRGLMSSNFPRIGVYDRHIHADIDDTLPPGMWAGVSK